MPSYADQMAESHAALRRRSGPVRLTISRGRPYLDGRGEVWYGDHWEEEEVMDTDEMMSLTEQQQFISTTLRSTSPIAGTPSGSSLAKVLSGLSVGASVLLVIDTNTLISCLNLLGALFDELFHFNLTALETSQAQAPLTILIPNVVVEELDALKHLHRETTLRRSAASRQRMSHSVGALARKANKWMLMALQTQKRTTCASPITPRDRIAVPEHSWALHVENKSHALAVQQQAGTDHALELSADQQIILLCRHLNRVSGSPACLCTSDANARLSAEAESISTFDLDNLDLTGININGDNDGEERRGWHALARDLIDQWKAQMGLIGNGGGSGGNADKFNDPMTDDPHPTASMAASDQTRFDSAHAADTGLTTSTTMLTLSSPSRHRLPASANGPARPSPMSARRLAQRITPDDYPDDTDRTTGSSFWAPERQIR